MAPPNLPDKSTATKSPRLLDQVRDKLRVKHYSIRSEQTYVEWIKRYIFFHDKRHPKELGGRDFAGDAWFPEFDRAAWRESAREAAHSDGLDYDFVTYERAR